MPTPAAAAPRYSPANPARSPLAHMRTVVHVQHLPGHVTGFRQINNSVGDVLRLGKRAIGERASRLPLVQAVSTTPAATALKRIFSFAYSFARLRVIALMPPLVIIGTDARNPHDGVIGQRCAHAGHAAGPCPAPASAARQAA